MEVPGEFPIVPEPTCNKTLGAGEDNPVLISEDLRTLDLNETPNNNSISGKDKRRIWASREEKSAFSHVPYVNKSLERKKKANRQPHKNFLHWKESFNSHHLLRGQIQTTNQSTSVNNPQRVFPVKTEVYNQRAKTAQPYCAFARLQA